MWDRRSFWGQRGVNGLSYGYFFPSVLLRSTAKPSVTCDCVRTVALWRTGRGYLAASEVNACYGTTRMTPSPTWR